MTPVPFKEAFRFWLKLGFISFGGPAGQIAVMHAELVERRRWISEKRFLHALNYCMLLPGPEAQQLATYIGWLMHRTRGGIVAGALFVLPSLLILIALSWVYLAFGDVPVVAGLFYGIKPAVTAIVLHAAYRIGSRALGNPALWTLAAAAFAAIFLFDVPFPAIVAAAAAVGFLGGRLRPDWFGAAGGHGPATVHAGGPALIDDHTPAPEHAVFRWSRLLRIAIAGLALWALPMAALTAAFGWHGTLTQMAWFFTKAALVTFGGAYAVLPYVYQGGVERFGWLSAEQMIDGLALGETTPGPLIMVVAFVGFVGGWQSAELQALSGAGGLFLAGAAAAVVVTWFTFLPSFVFILAGGPLVEATHGDLAFTAPLRAITAAVVGVILNLALFFAWHVFWPDGWGGPFDAVSAGLALAAIVALFRFRRGVMETILACGAVGLLVYMLLPAIVPRTADAVPSGTGPLPASAAVAVATPPAQVLETAHYRIESTATPAQTAEIGDAVEVLRRGWHDVLAVPEPAGEAPRLRLRLYRDRAEFQANNRSQPWAEAYYLDGLCHAYVATDRANPFHWMLHEAAHQLNREIAGWPLRKWANEGVATYLSTSIVRDGELHPGEIDPETYPVWWLDGLGLTGDRDADIAAGRFIPLAALITGEGAPPIAQSVNLHYVHWWSLVHFLFHHDGGRHADGFRALLREGGSREAFERLIGPLDGVEADWHAHLRGLEGAAASGRLRRDR